MIDLQSGETLNKFIGHQNTITQIQKIPGSQFFISVSKDNTIRIWNYKTLSQGIEIRCERMDLDQMIGKSAQGSYFLFGKIGLKISLISRETGKSLVELDGQKHDGDVIASSERYQLKGDPFKRYAALGSD